VPDEVAIARLDEKDQVTGTCARRLGHPGHDEHRVADDLATGQGPEVAQGYRGAAQPAISRG
jgi:hypothetical protein